MASTLIVDQLQKTGGSTTALTLPTSNASANEFLQNNGAGALRWASASAGFTGIHTDVTSGSATYAVPTGVTKLLVFLTGGGGCGGSGTTGVTYGSGGVAGGTVIASVTVVPLDTITIAIGAGGTAAGAGGSSTFTHASGSGSFDTITAPGGPAGVTGTATPGAPGTPTVGASNDGIAMKGGHPGPQGNGSQGAASFWGGGGTGYNSVPNVVATAGDAFGSGGGGGSYPAGYEAGGVGGVGVCLIMEFK